MILALQSLSKRITVIGSFKKNWDGMNKKALELRQNGYVVRLPNDIAPHIPATTLVEKWEDMKAFYDDIDSSDGVFVVNEDPHIGLATGMEISRALTQGKTITFLRQPEQMEFRALVFSGKAKIDS